MVVVMVLVVVVVLVQGDGGGGLRRRRSLVLAVVVVVVVLLVILGRHGSGCGRWRRWRRRREWRLGRRSGWRRNDGLPLQTQVFVLLAEPVQLDFQLLDPAPLSFQKLLLALDDVVEFKKVLHRPVRALRAALAWAVISIHN